MRCRSLPRPLLTITVLVLLAAAAHAEDDDFNTQMMRATVKIIHDKSTATGFILSKGKEQPHVLVTAAHVLETTTGDTVEILFRTRVAEGEYKRLALKITIRKDGKPLWTKHPQQDVAVLHITPPAQADLPEMPVALLATDELLKLNKIHTGDSLAFIGYPHRNEANDAGFAILRPGTLGSFPIVPTAKTHTFMMSGNVFEGDSGSAVYLSRPGSAESGKEEGRLILGLVSAQRFLDEEVKMVYGTTKVRHRLGLAIVIHASIIKETVELLK